jgi:hypothetical protein
MRWETVTFDRLSLYEKVWSTPISRLANQFGLSDVGLRKICKRLGVPMPALGYWAKIEHGRRLLPKPPLPRFAGETTYVHRRRIDDGAIAMQHKVDAALGTRELLPEPSIVLRDNPAEFHALVKRTARVMRKPFWPVSAAPARRRQGPFGSQLTSPSKSLERARAMFSHAEARTTEAIYCRCPERADPARGC